MPETEADVVDIEDEPLDVDEEHARIAASLKRKNIRTASYTDKEDKILCETWMTCGQMQNLVPNKEARPFGLGATSIFMR